MHNFLLSDKHQLKVEQTVKIRDEADSLDLLMESVNRTNTKGSKSKLCFELVFIHTSKHDVN